MEIIQATLFEICKVLNRLVKYLIVTFMVHYESSFKILSCVVFDLTPVEVCELFISLVCSASSVTTIASEFHRDIFDS